MVAKEELVIWFKNLESYKRIDVMCTLLNLCLPFELRFLGTCLEELGRRDAQDLRGAELRVNNPQEFNNDVGSFQAGQPTDRKMRRKMALYLALMRACNRTGVTELFRTLDRWGEGDFTKFNEGDSMQELLLVYTMATNHPVFNFEQRLKCGEIYSKISSGRAHLNQPSPLTTSPITTPLTSSTFNVQQHQTTSPPPPFPQSFQQPAPQIINPIQTPLMMAYSPAPGISSLIQTGDPANSLTLNLESLPSHLGIPPPMMQIPTDFSSPPWQVRYAPPPQIFPLVQMDTQFPPPSTSPHLSQPPSPTHSRTGSPSRQQQLNQNQVQQTSSQAQQQQMMPNAVTQSAHRNNRPMRNARPSTETTPPPLQQQQQQQQQQQSVHQQQQQASQGSGTIYMGNDIMGPTIKSFEDINMEGAISQLHSLRNGYTRPPNVISRHNNNNKQQNWTAIGMPVAVPVTMSYTMHMVDQSSLPNNMRKSVMGVGSDSGSSTGEASPPPIHSDPSTGLLGNANQTQSSGSLRNKQPLNLSRLNGGKHGAGGSATGANNNNNNNIDFNNGSQPGVGLVTSNSSGNLSLLIGGQMHNFHGYRTMPPPHRQTQQQQFQSQPNGELMYTFSPPFLTTQAPIVVSSVSQRASPSAVPVPTPYPTNKMGLSCFNCGSTNHTGLNCSEASMEDVTRNAVYKLDYTVNAPQIQFMTTVPMQSPASSSGTSTIQPANNNDPDGTMTFIDLTQDTTSSSSSSTSSIHGAK